MEGSGLDYPVQKRTKHGRRYASSGFTLLEVLTALFVIGVATTVFISLFRSSLALSHTSTHNAVAAQIAEEYMVELQVNPKQFAWPNFDGETGKLLPIKLKDEENPVYRVSEPTAMPTLDAPYLRESNLYSDYDWHAQARIQNDDSNFVEVLVQVSWSQTGRRHHFYLTSTIPRSVGEGIGI